jgi:F0F1-type ATP synthase beta subunit
MFIKLRVVSECGYVPETRQWTSFENFTQYRGTWVKIDDIQAIQEIEEGRYLVQCPHAFYTVHENPIKQIELLHSEASKMARRRQKES